MADYSVEDDDSTLETEVESLRLIYIHELEVDYNGRRPECVTVHLHPATADNLQKQYVRLSLILKLSSEYPNSLPEIIIRNPRGLSDEEIERISHDLYLKAEEKCGSPMLFELIEVAKEHLTLGNTPSCQCAICLYGFTEDDVFTKTECYHYFHSHCLARYVKYVLQKAEEEKQSSVKWVDKDPSFEVVCPVCRLPISYSELIKGEFPHPCEEDAEASFCLSTEMKQLQHQMANLYKKQKSRGGIIDLDMEKKRYLLEISNTSGDTDKNVAEQAEAPTINIASAPNDESCSFSSTIPQGSILSDNDKNSDVSHNETQSHSPVLSEKSQTRSYSKHGYMGNRSKRGTGYRGREEYRRKERDHRFGRHDGFETESRGDDKNFYKEAGTFRDNTYSKDSHSGRDSNKETRTNFHVYQEHNEFSDRRHNEFSDRRHNEFSDRRHNEFSDRRRNEFSDRRTDRYGSQYYPSTSKLHRGASVDRGTDFVSKHSFRGNRHSGHYREGSQKNRNTGSNFRSNYNSQRPGQYRGGRPFPDTYHRDSHSNNCVSPRKEDSNDSLGHKTQGGNSKADRNSEELPVTSKDTRMVSEPRIHGSEKSAVMPQLPRKVIGPPPGFAHAQKVIYGPPVVKPPPGFDQR